MEAVFAAPSHELQLQLSHRVSSIRPHACGLQLMRSALSHPLRSAVPSNIIIFGQRSPNRLQSSAVSADHARPVVVSSSRQQQQQRELRVPRSFELPPLYSRFPMRLPPDHESIREECEAWGLSLMGRSASAAQRQAFLDGRYDLAGPIFNPHCSSYRRLVLLSKMFIIFFIFDDMIELTPPSQGAGLLNAAVAAWQGAAPLSASSTTPAESQMATLFQRFRTEVWEEMCSDMTPAFQARLQRMMLEYVFNNRADQCSAGQYQSSIAECTAFRSLFVGGDIYFVLNEYSLGIDIGDQLTSVPIMAELRKHILNHQIWVNDLMSFRKEFLQDGGKYYGRGIIRALINEQMCAGVGSIEIDIQAAINRLCDMIQEEQVVITRLVDEVRGWFPPSSDLIKLVEACVTSLSTYMYWCTVSGRYGMQNAHFFHSKPPDNDISPAVVSLDVDPKLLSLKSFPSL